MDNATSKQLLEAARKNDLKKIKQLLSSGACPNIRDEASFNHILTYSLICMLLCVYRVSCVCCQLHVWFDYKTLDVAMFNSISIHTNIHMCFVWCVCSMCVVRLDLCVSVLFPSEKEHAIALALRWREYKYWRHGTIQSHSILCTLYFCTYMYRYYCCMHTYNRNHLCSYIIYLYI